MRILVLSNLFPPDWIGGYEIACASLSRQLARAGHTVRVLTSIGVADEGDDLDVARVFLLADRWRTKLPAISSEHVTRSWAGLIAENVVSLDREIRTFRPDVVLAFNTLGLGGTGITEYLELTGIPWVWSLGDDIPLVQRDALSARQRMLFRNGDGRYRSCQAVMVSMKLLTRLNAAGIRFDKPVDILPRGQTIRSRVERRPADPMRFLYLGRLDEAKGLDLVLDAASRLRQDGLDFSVDVYGTGDVEHYISRSLVLSLDDVLSFRGPLRPEAALTIFDAYDVLLFPTHEREALGGTILQAAASGKPAILTGSIGVAEYLVDGVHCIKIERNADDLAAAMRVFINSPDQSERLGRRAQALVGRIARHSHIVGRFESILKRAIAEKSKANTWTDQDVSRLYYAKTRLLETL